ncbi:hypothetical protein [Winogradskyella sp. PE311]|uniref:hypothetical protein n=1 Tax=Winogradskyella sp. PE311 TaxID=3366943 RepID=UPI003980F572
MIKTLHLFKIFPLFLLCSTFGFAQDAEDIIDNYSDYTEAPREIAYAHLNKSTYIEGEMLGFTTYIFDKYAKGSSKMTKNLYCTISDLEGNVIKKKLLKVDDGITSNIFEIDSLFKSGVFTFKAYTNWMRNFNESNHFEQTFKVIDADNLQEIKPIASEKLQIDLQLLGEGGHISYDVQNVIGIVAKNQFGLGIKNAIGKIIDENDMVISNFQLNNTGMAKVILNPKANIKYYAELNANGTTIKKEIENIKSAGIAMTLNSLGSNVIVKLDANDLFLKQFSEDIFKIALHDGSEMQITEFQLNSKGQIILSYPIENLYPGMNIFTIFSKNNQPILERLYFNLKNIKTSGLTNVASTKLKDSINVKGQLKNIDISKLTNLSVSILPSNTKSYNHHNNILSQLFIQPYVKGTIENASQYFKDTRESNYNLELLLLTQGWSSYNWNTIFNYNAVFMYPFERGIDMVANINGDNPGTYVLYPLEASSSQLFELKETDSEFTAKTVFPNDDDLFRIGYIDSRKKGFKIKPSIYPQFYPSKFPDFNLEYKTPQAIFTSIIEDSKEIELDKSWEYGEQLDEVVIEASKEFTRAEALANKAIRSKVDVINDRIKLRNQRLDLYLQRLGFNTQFDYFSGTLSITNPRVNWGTNVPLVYLNEGLLTTSSTSDFGLLTFLNMQDIDYIEYELYGVGGGIRGQAGFIKIYTSNDYKSKGKNDNIQTYDVPLRFNKEKTFYVSKFKYYNSSFYNEFGTIDWKPNLEFSKDGSFNFNVLNTKNSFKLFVEGVLNDDTFISQEIIIDNL